MCVSQLRSYCSMCKKNFPKGQNMDLQKSWLWGGGNETTKHIGYSESWTLVTTKHCCYQSSPVFLVERGRVNNAIFHLFSIPSGDIHLKLFEMMLNFDVFALPNFRSAGPQKAVPKLACLPRGMSHGKVLWGFSPWLQGYWHSCIELWVNFWKFIVKNCWGTLSPVGCGLANLGHSHACVKIWCSRPKYGLPKKQILPKSKYFKHKIQIPPVLVIPIHCTALRNRPQHHPSPLL